MHQTQQYHSASLQWLHIWNHTWVRIQEFIISILRHQIFHSSHSVTSEKSQDHPSLDLSGFSSARHGRQSPATCTLPAEHTVCAVFYFYRPPRRFVVNAIMWLPTPKPKPKTGFGLPKTEKPVLQKEPGFGNPSGTARLVKRAIDHMAHARYMHYYVQTGLGPDITKMRKK